MKKNIYTNAPPLIRTALKKDDGWAYRTDGHTMCISGYRNDLAYFMVGDPYIKWVIPNASMVYDKPASVIHQVISQRGKWIYLLILSCNMDPLNLSTQ